MYIQYSFIKQFPTYFTIKITERTRVNRYVFRILTRLAGIPPQLLNEVQYQFYFPMRKDILIHVHLNINKMTYFRDDLMKCIYDHPQA